ncbi:MAG: hypothetical protein ACLQU3_03920 [Limisphaerales bacterium]
MKKPSYHLGDLISPAVEPPSFEEFLRRKEAARRARLAEIGERMQKRHALRRAQRVARRNNQA